MSNFLFSGGKWALCRRCAWRCRGRNVRSARFSAPEPRQFCGIMMEKTASRHLKNAGFVKGVGFRRRWHLISRMCCRGSGNRSVTPQQERCHERNVRSARFSAPETGEFCSMAREETGFRHLKNEGFGMGVGFRRRWHLVSRMCCRGSGNRSVTPQERCHERNVRSARFSAPELRQFCGIMMEKTAFRPLKNAGFAMGVAFGAGGISFRSCAAAGAETGA